MSWNSLLGHQLYDSQCTRDREDVYDTHISTVVVKAILLLSVFVMMSDAVYAQKSKDEIKKQKKELSDFNKVIFCKNLEKGKKYLDLITNEKLLCSIVLEGRHELAAIAIKRITSEELLFRIALQNWNYAAYAVERITDTELLSAIADKALHQSNGEQILNKISEKIDNEDQLFQIAQRFNIDWRSRSGSVEFLSKIIPKIKNQYYLFEIIYNTKHEPTALKTIEKITELELLKQLADSSKFTDVRIAAINQIEDQSVLYEFVLPYRNNDSYIRNAALNKLSEELLQKIVSDTTWSNSMRSDILEKIKDQSFLYDVYQTFSNIPLKSKAFVLLTDQELLMKIAEEDKDWAMRKKAFNKLDSASLEKIALGKVKDKALAVAANIRLNNTTWEKEFSNRSSAYLGNVIGAAALVDNPKPTPANVVNACHTYIRRGDTARIPELRDLLLRYGDKSLAEDYLNCGHTQLYNAGAEWCRSHGYNIGTGYGSHRVSWGSGR